MTSDDEVIPPPRVEGRYIRPTNDGQTVAGCKTCGWYIEGSKDEVRQPWIGHTHDPIHDITERVLSGAAPYPEDVLWLLDERERNHV